MSETTSRACLTMQSTQRSYCGRKCAASTHRPEQVTCVDCAAAIRADVNAGIQPAAAAETLTC